jgi:spore maturation protein CgeB
VKVLLVYPVARMSILDVATGYHLALLRAGHDVRVYDLSRRWAYHDKAVPLDLPDPQRMRALSKQASETMLIEALYHDADLVLIISGLSVHPLALKLLQRAAIPTVVIHTESPYEDANQAEWSSAYHGMMTCTHERTSADRYGWVYLPHAYEPTIHWPRRPEHELLTDVLIVGTGWPERITLLEAINWTGMTLTIVGMWDLAQNSPLRAADYRPGIVPNLDVPRMYASAKINLNFHRAATNAVSLNPRGYELAACGACQVSDVRVDGLARFGASVPTFTTAADLEQVIRDLLADERRRRVCAADARARVDGETFDARLVTLLESWRSGAGQTVLNRAATVAA